MQNKMVNKTQKAGLLVTIIGVLAAAIIKNLTYDQCISVAVAGYAVTVAALIWEEYIKWLERERGKRRKEHRDAKEERTVTQTP